MYFPDIGSSGMESRREINTRSTINNNAAACPLTGLGNTWLFMYKTLPTEVNNSAPFYDSRSDLILELILMVSIDIMTNKLNMQSRAGSNAPALSRLPRILQEQTVQKIIMYIRELRCRWFWTNHRPYHGSLTVNSQQRIVRTALMTSMDEDEIGWSEASMNNQPDKSSCCC